MIWEKGETTNYVVIDETMRNRKIDIGRIKYGWRFVSVGLDPIGGEKK